MRVDLLVLLAAMALSTVSCTIANLFFPQIASVSGVQLSQATLLMVAGGSDGVTGTLSATVLPAGASNSHVVWSSSNSAVATVDGNGRVSSVHWGESVITATTADGGKTATCNVHVTNNFDPAVRTLTAGILAGVSSATGSYTNGAPGSAGFDQPIGVVSDGTTLYVADATNYVIRAVDIASGTVSLFAGTPGSSGALDASTGIAASFYQPSGIAISGSFLYVADNWNNNIRRIAIASPHAVSTVAGSSAGLADGVGSTAQFSGPSGVATDGTNLYVADTTNNAIRKVVISTGYVTTLAVGFNSPLGVACDGTNLYVADSGSDTVKEVVLSTGNVTTLASVSPPFYPQSVATDGINVYLSGFQTGTSLTRIRISDGSVTTTSTPASSPPPTAWPIYGLALDGSHLFYSAAGLNNVWQIQ